MMSDEQFEKLLMRACRNKRKLKTKEKADDAIDAFLKKGILMYYYNCPFCQRWHLTSKEPDETLNQQARRVY